MSSPSQDTASQGSSIFPNTQLSDMSQVLQQAYTDEKSSVGLIILHMSELLSSFVREDTPEKRAQWAAALAETRNGLQLEHAHEDLKFISDFSIMLEDGLQCLADKCAKLEQAVKNVPPREHDYVYGRSPSSSSGSPPLLAPVVKQAGKCFKGAAAAARKGKKVCEVRIGNRMSLTAPAIAKQPQFVACDLCKRAIPRLRMANHLRHVHPEEFNKIAKFRCPYCTTALFIKQASYAAHIESCQVRLEQESLTLRMPYADELICRMCGLQCLTLQELADHAEKMHPLCSILSCSGCGALFKQPDQVIAHWKLSKEQNPFTKCASSAPAALLGRPKLVGQMLAHAKLTGSDKDFTYAECMAQPIVCEECGFIAPAFKRLYDHVHVKHNKIVQCKLLYGCAGCNSKYRCPASLREHLLRSEIEEYEGCRNAGVVYWSGERISKDMRPKETIEKEERREKEKAEREKEEMEREKMEQERLAAEQSITADADPHPDADADANLEDMPPLSQYNVL